MTRSPTTRVLMYHGVDRVSAERDPHGMFVTPASFRAQMEQLLESGFTPVSEEAYLASLQGEPLPHRSVLITFDDGYVGVGEHAAPVLAELGMPAVLYVPLEVLGKHATWLTHRHPIMSADEVRDLAASGLTVGAHAFDHADLTTLTDADLRRQTAEAREELARVAGRPVRTFAFPYGRHDARTRRAVEAAGYHAAFAVHERGGRFGIQRVDVNATDTLRTFGVKLHRLYPTARRASRHFPRLRWTAHTLLGRAEQPEIDALAEAES